jgi:hypothetical protein
MKIILVRHTLLRMNIFIRLTLGLLDRLAFGAYVKVWFLHFIVVLFFVSAFNAINNKAKQSIQSWGLFWVINFLQTSLISVVFYINDVFRRKGWLVGRLQGTRKPIQSWGLFWVINYLQKSLNSVVFYIIDCFRRKGTQKPTQAPFEVLEDSTHNYMNQGWVNVEAVILMPVMVIISMHFFWFFCFHKITQKFIYIHLFMLLHCYQST